MGQFSMTISTVAGSVLGDNQQRAPTEILGVWVYRRALRSKGATTFGYVPRLAALREGGGHTALSHLTKLSRSFRSFCGPSIQLCLISGQRGAK